MNDPREKRGRREARPSKSETLTIRLDPKTRFMLEFISRLRGQTVTTVVERAISAAANGAEIQHEFGPSTNWRNYWSVIEGERALLIADEPELYPTYEEEYRLRFAKEHWQFFYTARDCEKMSGHYIQVIWPRIDEFIAIFEREKAIDYFAAGKAMKEAIVAAGMKPPAWPPGPAKFGKSLQDQDDEIPF